MPLATSNTDATGAITVAHHNTPHPHTPPNNPAPTINSDGVLEQKKKRGRHKPRNRQDGGENKTDGASSAQTQNATAAGGSLDSQHNRQHDDKRGPRRRRPAQRNVTTGESTGIDGSTGQSGRSTPYASGEQAPDRSSRNESPVGSKTRGGGGGGRSTSSCIRIPVLQTKF